MKTKLTLKMMLVLMILSLLPAMVMAQDGGTATPDPLGGATEFAKADERTSVKLMLDWTPNTNHTGFYVAQALGYYDEANLDVEIIEPVDTLVEAALDAGIVEFGVGFQDFTTYALVDGSEVISVAAIIQHNTSAFATIAANHPVDGPADLAALTYGGFSQPDLENAILARLLECNGATWDDSHYVDIGYSDPIELMNAERVDFSWIFYGWQGIQAQVDGTELDAVMFQDYLDCVPDYYTPILLTTQTMIDEQPDVVAAFVQATARGYAYAIENPDAAAQILLDAVPELDADLVTQSAEWLANQYMADAPRWGQQNAEVWQGFTDFLIENGIIEGPFDTSSVFTNDFLPGTVAE
ncbi:MAG: ABC transporter substrate-binding protein [Chloroflexi bacterium]|nr:ABC transporter substrate-binding protein [Chloroflexota bacterium]